MQNFSVLRNLCRYGKSHAKHLGLVTLFSIPMGFAVAYGIDNHNISSELEKYQSQNSAVISEIQDMRADYSTLETLYNEAKSQKISPGSVGPYSSYLRYPVQEGDSLWEVAKKLTGDGRYWSELAELNKLEDPYTINSGEELFFPVKWLPKRNTELSDYNVQSPSLPLIGYNEKWIMIDVTDATLSLMQGQNTVKTFPAATGRGVPGTETDWYSTGPGIYRIITTTTMDPGFLGGYYSLYPGFRFDNKRQNSIGFFPVDADGKIVNSSTGPGLTTGDVDIDPTYADELFGHAYVDMLVYVKW